jgi:hypothetical protein
MIFFMTERFSATVKESEEDSSFRLIDFPARGSSTTRVGTTARMSLKNCDMSGSSPKDPVASRKAPSSERIIESHTFAHFFRKSSSSVR